MSSDPPMWADMIELTGDLRITIGPAAPGDREALLTYLDGLDPESRSHRALYETSRSRVDEFITQGRWYLVRTKGRVIGEGSFLPFTSDGAIVSFSVAAEWRRHGVASILVHVLLAMAAAEGLSWLECAIANDNVMLGFLKRLGFVPDTEMGDGWYELRLDPWASEKTLVVASCGGATRSGTPTGDDIQSVLDDGADAVHLPIYACRDALIVIQGRYQPRLSDLVGDSVPIVRRGGRLTIESVPVETMTRADIRRVTGVEPLSLADALTLTAGRAKLIGVERLDSLLPIVQELTRFRFEEVVISSHVGLLVSYAKELGVRTALLLGSQRVSPTPWAALRSKRFPAARLRWSGADFVAPRAQLLRPRFGVLRWTEHPALVWGVETDQEIARCLKSPRVVAIVTSRPDAAVALRER
jgi:GNAT superfamily N-acetyltransferase